MLRNNISIRPFLKMVRGVPLGILLPVPFLLLSHIVRSPIMQKDEENGKCFTEKFPEMMNHDSDPLRGNREMESPVRLMNHLQITSNTSKKRLEDQSH